MMIKWGCCDELNEPLIVWKDKYHNIPFLKIKEEMNKYIGFNIST